MIKEALGDVKGVKDASVDLQKGKAAISFDETFVKEKQLVDVIEKEGYKVLFDFLRKVSKNTKLKEIKYQFGSRYAGKSKINKKHILIYFRSLFK